jgi:hypothetical protein
MARVHLLTALPNTVFPQLESRLSAVTHPCAVAPWKGGSKGRTSKSSDHVPALEFNP